MPCLVLEEVVDRQEEGQCRIEDEQGERVHHQLPDFQLRDGAHPAEICDQESDGGDKTWKPHQKQGQVAKLDSFLGEEVN